MTCNPLLVVGSSASYGGECSSGGLLLEEEAVVCILSEKMSGKVRHKQK